MGTCFCDIDHITNHYWAAKIGHCKTQYWPNLDTPSPKIVISTHKLTANSIVVQIMSNGITISFVTPILVLSQKKAKYMLRQTHNRPALVITWTCTYFAMIYSITITNQIASIMLYKSDIDKNMFCYLGQNLAIATTVLTNSDKIICYNCYMKHNWVHISTISITILAITERPKLAIAKLNIGQIWTLHRLKYWSLPQNLQIMVSLNK